MLEECDDAREYFYDVRTKRLYYNPNSTSAGPTGAERWVATQQRVPSLARHARPLLRRPAAIGALIGCPAAWQAQRTGREGAAPLEADALLRFRHHIKNSTLSAAFGSI